MVVFRWIGHGWWLFSFWNIYIQFRSVFRTRKEVWRRIGEPTAPLFSGGGGRSARRAER